MAGLFYVPGIASGITGITWIRSWESLVSILGVNLGFLCFYLSSVLDPILDPLVSILELLPDVSGKVFLSTSDTQIVQT